VKIRLIGPTVALGLLWVATSALAGAADYTFLPITAEIKSGKAVRVEFRLVDKAKLPVSGASFIRSRLDMAPDGMAQHVIPVTFQPAAGGTYALTADLEMAGRWQLSLAAKVVGESETIVGKLIVTVAE
jgi:YtkA-like